MRSLMWLLGIWALVLVLGLTHAKPLSLEELDKIETEINISSASSSSSSESDISAINPELPAEEDDVLPVEDEDKSSISIEERPKRSISDPDPNLDHKSGGCGYEDHPDHLAHEQRRWPRSPSAVDPKPDNANSSSEEETPTERTKAKVDSSGENSSSEEQAKANVEGSTESNAAARRKRQVSSTSQEHTGSSLDLESSEQGADSDIKTNSGSNVDSDATEQSEDADTETDVLSAASAAAETQPDKDKTSIEDYAQGCEVMEVSSKEANEATYEE